jgi:acetyltransferase-like isoleucine patch superfamily enzyme
MTASLKSVGKALAEGIASVVVLPAVGLYWLGRLVFGAEKAFSGWSQLFSLFPGMTGVYLRRAFYRFVLRHCGSGSWITFGTVFSHPTASVGRDVYVGLGCCLGDVTLEDDVLLGSHVAVMNGGAQHGTDRLDIPVREQPGVWPHITIGRDTWIGDRAVVLANVGKQCIVGAGSVVTKPLPDYAIAVGVPAKIVRYRTDPPANGRSEATEVITPSSVRQE